MSEIIDLLDKSYNDIKKLYQDLSKDDIFEINLYTFKISDSIFKPTLSYVEYYKLLKYLIAISKRNNLSIENKTQLDITYSIEEKNNNITYVISIDDNASINHYINAFKDGSKKNIFIALLEQFKNGRKHISLYKNIYNKNDLYPDMFNITFRKYQKVIAVYSDIVNIKNLKINPSNINFKLKNKIIVNDNNNYIQLSKNIESLEGFNFDVSQNKIIEGINTINEYYTIKVYTNKQKGGKKIKGGNVDNLTKMLEYCEKVLKVVQSSNFIITNTQKEEVLQIYRELLHANPKDTSIKITQVRSIEIDDLNILYNKYAVTDKADGEHALLIIKDNRVYLITQILDVLYTGITLKNNDYSNTIFDGEMIFIKKENRYIFMVFDCLYYKNEKINENPKLYERLEKAEEIIKECFVFKGQKYTGNNYNHNKTNIKDILNFYNKEIPEYFKILSKDIQIEKKLLLIRPKYFMYPIGCENNEIYQYSNLLWNIYKTIDYYPYNLDGMVYQPLDQTYYNNSLPLIKWKPEENNTIDFYIEFERDPDTNKIIIVNDNLLDIDDENVELGQTTHINTSLYKICKLYVDKTINNKEQPVLFNPTLKNVNKNIYNVILRINEKDGNVYDKEGTIIQDKTVVEFAYKNDNTLESKFRWVPLKTRYDKTEQVNKYHRRYGNNEKVAEKIWYSINYPITFNDIEILADINKYAEHKNYLLSTIAEVSFKQDTYYDRNNKLLENAVQSQKDFHNMVKTTLINTYCRDDFNNNKKVDVIDVGYGEGGDLLKYFNARVKSLVGIEPVYDNIYRPGRGALARYQRLKKSKPNMFPLTVINSTFTLPLDFNIQKKVIQDDSQKNIINFNKYLNSDKQYDVMCCMFAFHYFLENEQTWMTTCENINKLLKKDGYLLITCFDAHRVSNVLKNNKDNFDQFITVNNEKMMLHSIQKLFDNYKDIYTYGNKINVKVCSFMDTYNPEYLVDDNFIIPELNKHCGLRLIETDYFENIYNNMKDYILNIKDIEQKDDMRKFLNKISLYYNDNEINDECKKITFLNRYYVFKKCR